MDRRKCAPTFTVKTKKRKDGIINIACRPGTIGATVKIQQVSDYLTLCEVEIYTNDEVHSDQQSRQMCFFQTLFIMLMKETLLS